MQKHWERPFSYLELKDVITRFKNTGTLNQGRKKEYFKMKIVESFKNNLSTKLEVRELKELLM